jgi:hypothetical protein
MPVNITPIVSAVPVTIQPTETITYDTWFLKDFNLYATIDRKFNAKVNWVLGKLNDDGSSELSNQKGFCLLEDILSEQALTENPEIAAILPQFLGALNAVSRRKGAIK